MSSPNNPLTYIPPGENLPPDPLMVIPPASGDENPSWDGWDILALIIVSLLIIFVLMLITIFATHKFLFPRMPMVEVAKFPLVTVVAQMLAYCFVLLFMNKLAKRGPGETFWQAIRWNWPRTWGVYLLGGIVLSIGLQLLSQILPMPKELPIDRFFKTGAEAWALSIFGITMAPLLEELFFRGFLYPVFARRLGVIAAVILTSAGFGLIHAPQLAQAWGPVLVVFLVGLVLTIIRAVTKSVAASILVHMAYNGTISVLLFTATSGFQHLEKLNH